MHLRNTIRCAAMASLLITLSTAAHAVDPARYPSGRNSVVPQPFDPLIPTSNTGRRGGSGAFDPFSPNSGTGSGFGSTLPSNSFDPLRPNSQLNPQLYPGPSQAASRWRVGVYSTPTDTGVRVVRVTPGSPAHAVGLEENDIIVAVSGYQVGLLENGNRELGQAFNQYAGSDGHVDLLVQDNRTRSLTNLHVQLESKFQRIEGTVTFRDQVSMPRNAAVRIDLYETVRPGVTIPIVSQTITDLRRTPIPFSIDYDPSLIDPRREYTLNAVVTADNRTYYQTRNPYRVITDGYPRVADLRLFSTNSSSGYQDGFAQNRNEQIDQIVAWFRDYLQREIRPGERQVYTSSVARGESLDEIRAQLLGLPEFYAKSGHDDQSYIRNLYDVVLHRQPSQQEISAWLRQLDAQNGIRYNLAREFLASVGQQR